MSTTRTTVSYVNGNNIQNCITGTLVKSSKDSLVMHPYDTKYSSISINKNHMHGQILGSKLISDILDVDIIDYTRWAFDSEVHFLLPNKSVKNENDIIISGNYNSKKIISKDAITIETNHTMFNLSYNSNTSSWELDEEYIVEDKEYNFDLYDGYKFSSDIFYIGTNSCDINRLGVNSHEI